MSGQKNILVSRTKIEPIIIEPSMDGADISIKIEQHSNADIFVINLCEHDFRQNITVDLLGPGANVQFFGLDILHSKTKGKTELEINHHSAHTFSTQAFRGIYAKESCGSFLGKVIIKKDAHSSKASQRYKAIILDERAFAHVMPQLEINNCDISASHGASIGELDQNMLFYLCSRGISLSEAKSMLIKSLADDILANIKSIEIKSLWQNKVNQSIASSLGIF